MRTSELIGPALDWAVAKSEGFEKTWSNKAEYNVGIQRASPASGEAPLE